MDSGSWLSRPGTASTLTPSDGIAQECSTSSAVTTIRVCSPAGMTMRWSTSRSRGDPAVKSFVCNMYESKEIWVLSEYS